MNAIVRGNVSAYVEAGDVRELTEEEYRQMSEEALKERMDVTGGEEHE